jgi:hypothetical protein
MERLIRQLVKPIPRATLQQIFKQELRSDDGAGSVIRDFETLLDFIGSDGLAVSGQNHWLPLRRLPDLNARLTRPIQLDLKRPQQISYPSINGLYLLARASGLVYIDQTGSKPTIRLDLPALQSWAGLNPSEKYFTLLESWLMRGNPEILGERSYLGWMTDRIRRWAYLFERTPPEGRPIAGDSEAEVSLRYTPGLYNLALLELFGLMVIQHMPPEPSEGWRIGRLYRTPLGEAVLNLLVEHFEQDFDYLGDPSEAEFVPGRLQPVFQPYVPQWQNNLAFPEVGFREGLFVFKVSLGRVWRRLAVPATLTLDELRLAILNSFEFDDPAHLYAFKYPNRFGSVTEVNHPESDEGPYTNKVRVGDISLRLDATMIFLFDYIDNWEFEMQLEQIEPADPQLSQAVVLESQGRAPAQYDWVDEEEEL